MIDLRFAYEKDVDLLIEGFREAHGESSFKGDFDPEMARNYISNFINMRYSKFRIAVQDNEILGGVMMAASYEWCRQPLAYVVKFWVFKKGRRTRAARLLLDYVNQFAQEYDCSAIYATATAELDATEQKLFENLFHRNGFDDVGATLRKDCNG